MTFLHSKVAHRKYYLVLKVIICLGTFINSLRVINTLENVVHRLLLSPLVPKGLLGTLFVSFALSGLGKKLEQAYGSLGLLTSIVSQILATNMLHLALCATLAYNPVQPSPNFMRNCASGYWVSLSCLTNRLLD